MTKGELRKARKEARKAGKPLTGDLALPSDRGDDPLEFSEGYRGEKARYRWARAYDALNGSPEGDSDR